MGSPEFAVPSLERLAVSDHNVCAVVSGTDKKRGRGGRLTPTPIKARAIELEIPVIEANSMKDSKLHEQLRALKPDLFVVVAFKILPTAMLQIPLTGSVNLHASLLPKYRGAAPIHHAVMNGETETGCTVFLLDNGVDTGKIIDRFRLKIGPDETTGELYNRMMISGADLLLSAINKLAGGKAVFETQNSAEATPAPKLFDEDCRLNFRNTAAQVHNHIRGLSPFPTAYALLDGKKCKILSSKLPLSDFIADGKIPGQIYTDGDLCAVQCADRSLLLGDFRFEGKKQMPAADFFRGYTGSLTFDME